MEGKEEEKKALEEAGKAAQIGFQLVAGPGAAQPEGQLTLDSFLQEAAEPKEEKGDEVLGLALAYGEGKACFLWAGQGLAGGWLAGQFLKLLKKVGSAVTFGWKGQLPWLTVDKESQAKVSDLLISAYLLNPLKNDYSYDDVAKEQLGFQVPSRSELLGKMPLAQAAAQKRAELSKYAMLMASVAYQAAEPLGQKLKDAGMWE